ncbi:MAG: hypothetical protein ETSY2_32990 [Candidatus Entotheonella gemina]|uniref:Uncharacterized protein n=1 Tax=Candidatus Entotheonella gemina TaxID=1429439 RepID=W4M0B1_9BACT|nr:MAG: hypothetical protein ETSY2_32990 [Candidatus Entotheonella gemina]
MAIVITKEMGLTHREFYRTFPSVAGEWAWRVADDVVTLDHPSGPVTIYLEPERRRTIALISLPATTLRFEFATHDQAEVDAFIQRFDTRFRRGGG